MGICLRKSQLAGSCYFEFQRGWQDGRFWLADSLYLPDEDFDRLELPSLLFRVIPEFNYYGPTRVTTAQWAEVLAQSAKAGLGTRAVLQEINQWVRELPQEPGFSVLGI